MPEQTPAVAMERKLAAIFSTDVAGYSRLMGDDEAATIRTLTAYRAVMTTLIQRHRGRVVDSPGDNLLAEFASALDPNNADSYAFQAEVLNLALSRPGEALPAVKQAIRLNPHYPSWYLIELGYPYRMTGQYAEAITTLRELISRSPTFLPAYNNLVGSYLLQWRSHQSPAGQTLELALEVARQALAFKDPLTWNPMTLGYVYHYQRQYDQALAEMERAVTLGPTEAHVCTALAEVLSAMGRTGEALEAVAKALRLKSDGADEYLGNVGTVYVVTGRYEEALAPLQRFLNCYPSLLPAHLMLAVVYNELGQDAEARAEGAEVLRLNPNFSLEVHKQRMPIKDPAVLEWHIAALRKAGLK